MRPLIWKLPVEPTQDTVCVLAPCRRNGGCGNCVFENKVPANNPGDKFAHGRVGVGVGTARNWNHRSKLGVTKAGKGAADSGDDERKHDRWARSFGDG